MSILSDRSNRPPASTVNPYARKFLAPVSAGRRDAHSSRGLVSVVGVTSECLKEGEQRIGRAVAAGIAIHGGGSGERLFLDREK